MNRENEMSVVLTVLTDLWPYLSPAQKLLLRLQVQAACLALGFSRLPIAVRHGVLTSAFAFAAFSVLPSPHTLPHILLPVLWAGCYASALAVLWILPTDKREMI